MRRSSHLFDDPQQRAEDFMISLRWFCAKFFVKIRFDRFGIFAVVGLDDLVGFLRLCDVQAVYTQQRGGQARPAGGAAPYRMIFGEGGAQSGIF